MVLKYITEIFVGEKIEWELKLHPKNAMAIINSKETGTWLTRIFVPGFRTWNDGKYFAFDKEGVRQFPFGREVGHRILVGRIYSTSHGSRVVARLRLPIFSFITSALVLAIAFIYGIAGAIIWVRRAISEGEISQLAGAAGFCLLPISALAVDHLLRRSGAGIERDLIETFSETLEPHLVKPRKTYVTKKS